MLERGHQVIKYNAAGTPTPATNFTVVGTAVNTTISTWQYSVNGGSFYMIPAGEISDGDTVTISPTTITFNTLSIRASDGTISDTITIAAMREGRNKWIAWVNGHQNGLGTRGIPAHQNNDTGNPFHIYYRLGNTWSSGKYARNRYCPSATISNYSRRRMLFLQILIRTEQALAGFIFIENANFFQKGEKGMSLNGEDDVVESRIRTLCSSMARTAKAKAGKGLPILSWIADPSTRGLQTDKAIAPIYLAGFGIYHTGG